MLLNKPVIFYLFANNGNQLSVKVTRFLKSDLFNTGANHFISPTLERFNVVISQVSSARTQSSSEPRLLFQGRLTSAIYL